jgi:hypothetical protein
MSVDSVEIREVSHVRNTAMADKYLVVNYCRQGQPAEQILEDTNYFGCVTLCMPHIIYQTREAAKTTCQLKSVT